MKYFTAIIQNPLFLFYQNCTVWMPSTPVSKETALKFVKGSHLWGKWFIPTNFESLQNYAKGGQSAEIEYEETPEINENEHEIVSWDLEVRFKSV